MKDGSEFPLEEILQFGENLLVSPIVYKFIFKSDEALGLFNDVISYLLILKNQYSTNGPVLYV